MDDAHYAHLQLKSAQEKHAREIELHRRAAAGDQTAKNALEAPELATKARSLASKLEDAASKGDGAAMVQLRQLAAGKVPGNSTATTTAAPARPAAANRITRDDVGAARITARAKERSRWATVFASEHSRGRERGCVALLTSDKNWSAEQIVANLPELPRDREGANSGARAAAADAVWDHANAINQRDHADGGTATPGASGPAADSADAVWDRARAIVDSTKAKAN